MMSVKSLRRKWQQEKLERLEFFYSCDITRVEPDGHIHTIPWEFTDIMAKREEV